MQTQDVGIVQTPCVGKVTLCALAMYDHIISAYVVTAQALTSAAKHQHGAAYSCMQLSLLYGRKHFVWQADKKA